MLFKFKSQVTSDLIMLEPDARRLLHIMLGHDPVKGIILVKDLPSGHCQAGVGCGPRRSGSFAA
jgi:hypothetical protein